MRTRFLRHTSSRPFLTVNTEKLHFQNHYTMTYNPKIYKWKEINQISKVINTFCSASAGFNCDIIRKKTKL